MGSSSLSDEVASLKPTMDDYSTVIQDFEVSCEYWGEGRGEGRDEKRGPYWVDADWVAARRDEERGPYWLEAAWAVAPNDEHDGWYTSTNLPPEDQRPYKPPQLTESQKRRGRRHDSSALFEVPEYKVNEELYLEVVADDETLQDGLRSMCYLKLKIVNLLGTPWRSGCVMEVKCQEAPDPDHVGRTFVLKLIDSRFLGDIRCWRRLQNPTISTMKRFINMVCCGAVDEFLTDVDEKNYTAMSSRDIPKGALFSEWQQVALIHKHCQTVAEGEINAYNRLQELQGRCIPHLMYRVRTCPWHRLQAPFDRYFQYDGFVMEKVDGICLDDVRGMPQYFEREVCREAINAVNSLEYYGFEHKSLAARNLMVRHERQLNGTPCVMLIDLHKHLTWSSEDGYFKYKNVWAGSMERMMKGLLGYCNAFWFEEEDGAARNEEWEESIATGRFGEKAQLLNIKPGFKPGFEDGPPADARSIADARALIEARIRWRVIMDDLWTVDPGKDNLKGIDERASRSRIAHKIMRVSLGHPSYFKRLILE